jgi:hypothetical protein
MPKSSAMVSCSVFFGTEEIIDHLGDLQAHCRAVGFHSEETADSESPSTSCQEARGVSRREKLLKGCGGARSDVAAVMSSQMVFDENFEYTSHVYLDENLVIYMISEQLQQRNLCHDWCHSCHYHYVSSLW